MLYYYDESDSKKTGSLVEKLITEDEVDFLLGPYGSSCTLEAAAVANEYGVPMVQGGGAAEEIFTSGFEYTFGLLNPAADYFKNILTWATSINLTPSKVAIISASDIFSVSAAEGAKDYAEELEIFDVISIVTFETVDELQSILSDLKKEEPNMVLLAAHLEEAVSFVNAAKDVELNPEMFGITAAPSDPAFVTELGEDANCIFGAAQWVSTLPYDGPVFGSPEGYAQLFRDKYGTEPDYHAAAATACGVTYQLALEQVASVDREDVRDALASLDATTFYGRIKFDEQGRITGNPMVAFQVQLGNIVTIFPEDLATGLAIYPTLPWGMRERLIKINAGQEFTIALDENPTTGYLWRVEYDDSFVELVEDKYEPSSEASGDEMPIEGAGGIRLFKFSALVSGETEVTMVLNPPGGGDPAETRVFTISIY
ncbi:MAG: ABC transporter substrate-binding protein [Dehalococcoidia bacterium]